MNTAGQSYQEAFKQFQSLTGLEVHYLMRPAELPADRVINSNHNEGAHIGEQHGIIVVPIAANAGYAEAIGGPGTPASISRVVTPAVLPKATTKWQNYLRSSLIHELLHACNVYHHGDGHSLEIDLFRLPTDEVLAGGKVTTVLTEDGTSAAPLLPLNTNRHIILGLAGDCHTGNDDCVMRYDDAEGYISKSDPTVIYFTPGEPAGTGICTSPQGTGVNDPDRSPQPRYGDAAFNRGNCLGRIRVNDAGAAK